MINRIDLSQYKLINKESNISEFNHYKCGNNFKINSNLLNARLNLNSDLCLSCNPLKSYSHIYLKLKNIFDEYNIKYFENDRIELDGKEIDLYIPSMKLGFEIDGLYWHSSKYKSEMYHVEKQNLAREKGIRLIQFFEDEIEYKYDIVESMIKNKINANINKIFARKTTLKKISNLEYKNFVIKNHIQGYYYAHIIYGLYYNNELISIMSFIKRKNNSYELLRYCSILNTQIVGGASKLLNYFINNIEFNELYTYANRRYSDGLLYEKIGFEKISENKLNYWYVNLSKKIRHHRLKYQKHKLVALGYDINKTQDDIMNERKIYKIYDSGTITFRYKKSQQSEMLAF
jgi:very-short-patch-repair endonuclease